MYKNGLKKYWMRAYNNEKRAQSDFKDVFDKVQRGVEEMRSKSARKSPFEPYLSMASVSLDMKCAIIRMAYSANSTKFEQIIKRDLKLNDAINNSSGDAEKNGIRYEIKCSVHGATTFNWNQIRPFHTIDFYILVGYDLNYTDQKNIGRSYIFKVPAADMYNLVVEYGGYCHGTVDAQGVITQDHIKNKGRDFSYKLAVRPIRPDGKQHTLTKGRRLWETLKQYSVEYNSEKF
jgi:hypothetical protein